MVWGLLKLIIIIIIFEYLVVSAGCGIFDILSNPFKQSEITAELWKAGVEPQVPEQDVTLTWLYSKDQSSSCIWFMILIFTTASVDMNIVHCDPTQHNIEIWIN